MREGTTTANSKPEDVSQLKDGGADNPPGRERPYLENGSARKAKIALIDHRPLTLQSLHDLLGQNGNEFDVMAITRAEELVACPPDKADTIDLILFSIGACSVSDEKIRTDVELLKANFPSKPLVVLSDLDGSGTVLAALQTVDEKLVQGCIATSETPAIVVEELRLVLAGGVCFPFQCLIQSQSDYSRTIKLSAEQRNQGKKDQENLTPRQLEVAAILREGKPNKIIAYELGMKESTVKVHVRQIMKKMNATNRTQAALLVEQFIDD